LCPVRGSRRVEEHRKTGTDQRLVIGDEHFDRPFWPSTGVIAAVDTRESWLAVG